jgi:hypothetical protein
MRFYKLNLSSRRTQIKLIIAGAILLVGSGIALVLTRPHGPLAESKPVYEIGLKNPVLSAESLKKVPAGFPVAYLFGAEPKILSGAVNQISINPPPADAAAKPYQAYKIIYDVTTKPADVAASYRSFFERTQWFIIKDVTVKKNVGMYAKRSGFGAETMSISATSFDNGKTSRVVLTLTTRFPYPSVSSTQQ